MRPSTFNTRDGHPTYMECALTPTPTTEAEARALHDEQLIHLLRHRAGRYVRPEAKRRGLV